MYYIIDGYNLFFQITEDTPTEANKDEFVLFIAKTMKAAGLSGEMIFDTPIHHETLYAHSLEKPPLTIILAPNNLEADDLIVEKLYAIKNPHDIVVVTSDRALSYRVKEQETKVITVKSFMSLLRKKNAKKNSEKKPIHHIKKEVDRYESIFLKRLEDENE